MEKCVLHLESMTCWTWKGCWISSNISLRLETIIIIFNSTDCCNWIKIHFLMCVQKTVWTNSGYMEFGCYVHWDDRGWTTLLEWKSFEGKAQFIYLPFIIHVLFYESPFFVFLLLLFIQIEFFPEWSFCSESKMHIIRRIHKYRKMEL